LSGQAAGVSSSAHGSGLPHGAASRASRSLAQVQGVVVQLPVERRRGEGMMEGVVHR